MLSKKIIILTVPFLLLSCFNKTLVRGSRPVVKDIEKAFLYDDDLELSQQAIPALIRITEGLHYHSPEDPFVLSKICFLQAAYTFAYMDDSPYSDFEDNADEALSSSALRYEKAMEYGLKSLSLENEDIREVLFNESSKLTTLDLDEDQVEAAFWLAFSWALQIFNNTDDPRLVAQLDNLILLADAIAEADATYLQGAVYALYIAYYGGRSETLGGDYQKASDYYQKGMVYAGGKSLILDYVWLRFVSLAQGNEEEFDAYSEKILNFNNDQYPEMRFINQVMKAKTESMLSKREDFFF